MNRQNEIRELIRQAAIDSMQRGAEIGSDYGRIFYSGMADSQGAISTIGEKRRQRELELLMQSPLSTDPIYNMERDYARNHISQIHPRRTQLFDPLLFNEILRYEGPTVIMQKQDTPIPEELVGLSEVEIIQRIHAEVDSAPENLIKDAYEILNQSNIKLETLEDNVDPELLKKATRMRKLGFSATGESKVLDKLEAQIHLRNLSLKAEIKKREEVQKSLDLALNYQRNYPFAKFLTMDQLKKICDKYALIYAPSSAYIKTIPDKNLTEIENAQEIMIEDTPSGFFKISRRGQLEKNISIEEIINILAMDYTGCLPLSGTMKLVSEFLPLLEQTMKDAPTGVDMYGGARNFSIINGPEAGFHIAAPADHFDLKGLTWDKNMGYVKPFIKNDPIVFRYVKGGVLVDSKWGAEAADPLLLNPVNN